MVKIAIAIDFTTEEAEARQAGVRQTSKAPE